MCAWQLYFTSSSFKWSMKTIGNNLICLNMWFSGKVFHDMIFFYHLTLNIQYMIWIKIYNNACQVYFKYKKDSRILFCWCSFTHTFSSLVRLWLIRFYFNTLLERIFFSYFFLCWIWNSVMMMGSIDVHCTSSVQVKKCADTIVWQKLLLFGKKR